MSTARTVEATTEHHIFLLEKPEEILSIKDAAHKTGAGIKIVADPKKAAEAYSNFAEEVRETTGVEAVDPKAWGKSAKRIVRHGGALIELSGTKLVLDKTEISHAKHMEAA